MKKETKLIIENISIDKVIYFFIIDVCIKNKRTYTCISNKFISTNLNIDEDLVKHVLYILNKRNYINIKYDDKKIRYIHINV